MAGKRLAEKKTPERIHIGSMTTFMRPGTPSVVGARHATSKPRPENDREFSTQRNASPNIDPRNGTPKTSHAKPRKATTSTTSITSRDSRKDIRYCQRGIGEATRRLSR